MSPPAALSCRRTRPEFILVINKILFSANYPFLGRGRELELGLGRQNDPNLSLLFLDTKSSG